MQQETSRSFIERTLFQIEASIEFSETDLSWLSSKAFEDYKQSWGDLIVYYRNNYDDDITVVSIEVLHAYLHSTRFIMGLLQFDHLAEYHTELAEALDTLEEGMDQVINQGFAKLNEEDDLQP